MDLDRLMVWMEPSIDASFVPPPFDPGVALAVLPAAGRSEDAHTRVLKRWNGFYALDGLLHVLGACETPPNHSLRAWNAPDGWRAAWGRATEGLVFFAQDAFGDQFAYRGGKIVRLRARSGRVEAQQATLTEWIEAVMLDPDYVLDRRTFQACVKRLGPLPRGGHFVSTVPVAAGEPLDPSHAHVVPTRDSMEMLAVSARNVIRRSSSSIRLPKG